MSSVPYDQRLANLCVKVLERTPVTPNMVTSLGLAAGLLAAYLYALGDPTLRHWGAAVFLYAVLNDHIDGQLARATGKTSRFGHYYDHFAVSTSYIGLFVGAGIGFGDGWLGAWAPVLGVTAGLSVAGIFIIRMVLETRAGSQAVKQGSHAGFEIEDTMYVVAPLTWLDLMEPFLFAAGIGAPLFLIWVAATARRTTAKASADP